MVDTFSTTHSFDVTRYNIGDAVVVTDPEARVTFMNPVAEALTGWRTEEAAGAPLETVFVVVDEGTRQPVENPVDKALRMVDVVGRVGHSLLISRDGTERLVEDNAAPFQDESGHVAGALLVFRDLARPGEDLTDMGLTRGRLQASEERYRRLFESARDGILILDAETMEVIDANPYMSELLGYSREEFQGKQLWEIGLFKDKAESEAAVLELRANGYVRYEDLPLMSTVGDVQEVEFVCNVYQEDGRPVAQCNIRDITERKGMERQILEHRQALVTAGHRKDEFLAVLSRDITERRRMARQIMEQSEELAAGGHRKDQFLAMLSHELRNPLAAIFSALQLAVSQDDENDIQKEACGVIERQVRHLSRLVDDLLEVSRITTGRIHLQLGRVDVNGVVRRAIERVQPHIDRREQRLSLTLPEDDLWLRADSTRVEQVVENLLDNASKYNTAGGRIQLTVEREGDSAVIRVWDDGIGMPPEFVPHVFNLFAQVEKPLARAEGSLGIGLALVKNLVGLHHGTVVAHSGGIGRGSEFVVRLPLEPEDAPLPGPVRPPLTDEVVDPLRVLVVDDNEDAARMSGLLLQSWGYEVRVVFDGAAALEQAVGFDPQVILLDIGLPDIDGYEVIRQIRQNPLFVDMRLVAVTGYGQDADRRRSEEAGFDIHLTKPVEASDLQELLAGIHPATA